MNDVLRDESLTAWIEAVEAGSAPMKAAWSMAVAAMAFFLGLALALPACTSSASEAEGPHPPTIERVSKAASMTFATRQLLRAFRWGAQPGELPRIPSGIGGFDDDSAPTEVLHASGPLYWLRDPASGSFFIVDTVSGSTVAVDLRAGLPEVWQRALLLGYGMTRSADGGIAVLGAARPTATDQFKYFVRRFEPSGAARGGLLPLDSEAWARDSPRRLAVAPDGTFWVGLSNQTVALSAGGRGVARVPATGVLLGSGLFLSDQTPPRLHDSQGNTVGTPLSVRAGSEPPQWLTSGPGDVLLSPFAIAPAAPALSSLELYAVHRLALPERRLVMVDLIAVPARQLQPERADAPDATPLRSYFPPQGMAFTKEGDLVQLELTDTELRLYLRRQLKAGEDWTAKFADVHDASPAELALLRSEYLARRGRLAADSPYRSLFTGMAWSGNELPTRSTNPSPADDPILQRLLPQAGAGTPTANPGR